MLLILLFLKKGGAMNEIQIEIMPKNPEIKTMGMLLDDQVNGLFEAYLQDTINNGLLKTTSNPNVYLNNDNILVRIERGMAFETTFLQMTNPLTYLLDIFNVSLPPLMNAFPQDFKCTLCDTAMVSLLLCKGVSASKTSGASGNHWICMVFTFKDLNKELWRDLVQRRNNLGQIQGTLKEDMTVSPGYVVNLREPTTNTPPEANEFFLDFKNLYKKVEVTYLDSSVFNEVKKGVSKFFFRNTGDLLSPASKNKIQTYLRPLIDNLENVSFNFPTYVAKQGISFMCGDFIVINCLKYITKSACDKNFLFRKNVRTLHCEGKRITLWPRDVNKFLEVLADKVKEIKTKNHAPIRDSLANDIRHIVQNHSDLRPQEKIDLLLEYFQNILTQLQGGGTSLSQSLKDLCMMELGFDPEKLLTHGDFNGQIICQYRHQIIEKHKINNIFFEDENKENLLFTKDNTFMFT